MDHPTALPTMLLQRLLTLTGHRKTLRRVFGIGWAKTGTTTLGACLRTLGYRHLSQRLDLVQNLARGDVSKVLRAARRYQSFDDWPWILLYKELDQAFPDSRFVLTTRHPDSWLRSYRNMLDNQDEPGEDLITARKFIYRTDPAKASDQTLLARYLEHQEAVLEYFKDRPSDLLVVNWEAGDDWTKLCDFLGHSVPAQPFPHANKGHYSTVAECAETAIDDGTAQRGNTPSP